MVLAFVGLTVAQVTLDLWDLWFHVLQSHGSCDLEVERGEVCARFQARVACVGHWKVAP